MEEWHNPHFFAEI